MRSVKKSDKVKKPIKAKTKVTTQKKNIVKKPERKLVQKVKGSVKTKRVNKTEVKTSKRSLVKKTVKKKHTVSVGTLKKRIAELETRIATITNDFGKAIEANANFRFKVDALLGQILKGLYLLGVGPDEIVRKCSQMFKKVQV